MTEKTLVERLRDRGDWDHGSELLREAADTIERLEVEVELLRELEQGIRTGFYKRSNTKVLDALDDFRKKRGE